MLGTVLLTGIYEIVAGEVTPIAAGAGLLSSVSYAVFIFGFKYAAPHDSAQAILVIAFAVLAAVLICLGDADQTVAVLSTPSWPCSLCWGARRRTVLYFLYRRPKPHRTGCSVHHSDGRAGHRIPVRRGDIE